MRRVRTVTVSFGEIDPLSLEAVTKYEEVLVKAERQGTRVKALILCTPHNPLGMPPLLCLVLQT